MAKDSLHLCSWNTQIHNILLTIYVTHSKKISSVLVFWHICETCGPCQRVKVISGVKTQVHNSEGLLITCFQCKSLNLDYNSLRFSKVVDKEELIGATEKGMTSWCAVMPSVSAVGNPSHSYAHRCVYVWWVCITELAWTENHVFW